MDLCVCLISWIDTLSGAVVVDPLVNLGYFIDPPLALTMLKGHDLFVGPVKMIGDVGYLLKQPV